MLNIPDEIKELLHQDSCKKNIRIHFPNGERTDICNDLIVMDSVKFTESLCSQNELKFGLCESPVFECEVVGVGNIKGASIEVTCEIYCPSTVSGAVYRPDLNDYVYSIPYGTFIVQEAKRQADMNHRRIQAYRADMRKSTQVSWYAQRYMEEATKTEFSVYTPSVFLFLLSCMNIKTDNIVFFDSASETYLEESFEYPYETIYQLNQYATFQMYVKNTYMTWNFDDVSNPITDLDNFFQLFVNQDSVADAKEALEDDLYDHGWRTSFDPLYAQKINIPYIYPAIVFYHHTGETVNSEYYGDATDFLEKCPFCFYPYKQGLSMTLKVLKKVEISILYSHSVPTYAIDTGIILNSYDLKKYTLKSAFSFLKNDRFSFPLYLTRTASFGPGYLPNFTSMQDIDMESYLSEKFEILGQMGRFNRENVLEMIDIKRQFGLRPSGTLYPGNNTYPEGVTGGKLLPQDYQSCWYEDEYTKPYGAVYCKYKNTSNVESELTLYLTGYDADSDPYTYKVYSLEGNKVIDSTTWTQTQIQDICNQIAANIEGVSYMPVDFVGRGLPYVEAGDTFEILTASNDSITTIVLNRTISGEQVLTDSYKSV